MYAGGWADLGVLYLSRIGVGPATLRTYSELEGAADESFHRAPIQIGVLAGAFHMVGAGDQQLLPVETGTCGIVHGEESWAHQAVGAAVDE